jgi:hypothetical protein
MIQFEASQQTGQKVSEAVGLNAEAFDFLSGGQSKVVRELTAEKEAAG